MDDLKLVPGESGYKEALVEQALPFLTSDENDMPQVLILAAEFDALEVDSTSGLKLLKEDFREIGRILHDKFGKSVAIGLEGGYVWQDGTLGEAVAELMRSWAE